MELCCTTSAANFTETGIRFPIWIFPKTTERQSIRSFGFFSEAYGAEISGLTIQGKLDVSNSGYVFFGTVAGVAEDSKISDCVSDVSFTDTDKYINGPAALCGYAINSTIEHCQNKGNFSVTTDTTSLQMGGIVGLAAKQYRTVLRQYGRYDLLDTLYRRNCWAVVFRTQRLSIVIPPGK